MTRTPTGLSRAVYTWVRLRACSMYVRLCVCVSLSGMCVCVTYAYFQARVLLSVCPHA